jgi:hypothetical protein
VKSEQKSSLGYVLRSRQGKDNCPSENNITEHSSFQKLKKENVHRLRIWSTESHSQREKITKGVLSCYTNHRKTRLFTQEKELKRVHGKGSGNKETQSSNMPREIVVATTF